MKRFYFFILVGFLCCCVIGNAQTQTVVLLHTNDIHASFLPHEAFWVKETPKPFIGGFRELEAVVDSIRRVHPTSLLLDAGDVMTGNPITEYEFRGAEGGALFQMMNYLKYDAWTVGNHDFDVSVDNLRKITSIVEFPTIAANVRDSSDAFPINNKEYLTIVKHGVRIGIFGIMSKEFYGLVNKNSARNIKILPPLETAKRIVQQLRPNVDILIALTHQGVEDDEVLARTVQGIDVIIGGHSHTRLHKPRLVNGTLIAQAGSNCEYLGVVTLQLVKRSIVAKDAQLIPLWNTVERPKTRLSNFIDSVHQIIENDYAAVLGELRSPWLRGRGGESGVGNFIADAQREAANADVAFMNDHGIRQDVGAGPITKRKLFEVLPFRNVLCVFKVRGSDLRRIVEYYIKEKPAIQTSGVKVEWYKNNSGDVVYKTFLVNGRPLVDDREYSVAASDYFIGEAKRYLGIEVPEYTILPVTVFSAVEKKIRSVSIVDARVEGRISQIFEK